MNNLREVLKTLMGQRKLNASELARQTGIGQPVIFRMTSGETDNPKVATLSPLASYFGVTINQLIGETPLSPQEVNEIGNAVTSNLVPILSWDQAIEWDKIISSAEKASAFEKIVVDNIPTKNVYALKINDDSMHPLFDDDTLLLIDGSKKPKNGGYAVVHPRRHKNAIFRQVLMDDDFHYLKPLNPNAEKHKMKLFSPGDQYLGVLVQARRSF